MKPLAKLVIQKLREYKKSCSEQDETYLDFADLGAARPGENQRLTLGLAETCQAPLLDQSESSIRDLDQ